jgi:molecular chaperone DnaK
MSSMINFGIDLGTSNSLIAKFEKGRVEVFKNPNGFKETLPSIVGFRNDRTLIGEQARAYAERDPKSVVSRFKRKMGTSETLKIKALGASKSPVELSAYVLKELKGFVHTGEQVGAAVITIPASFDTVQSNATKEAGEHAGFKTVVLLQEPIAASLAYANKEKSVDLRNSQWIVYDLGGGTFDVALVRIVEGELTVVDHEGDNYLGGSDFDASMVEMLIVPELERRGSFHDLLGQMKSESGTYNKLWTVLLHKVEEAKIELSTKTSAEIDLGSIRDLEDDNGKAIDSIITITRSEFEAIIKASVDTTTDMMKRILTRNSLQPADLRFVLMVGGATYSPYVRKRVEEVMGIPVNTSIDPTNAIAVGAAFFAGTKELRGDSKPAVPAGNRSLKIRAAYNRNSQEAEEIFTAKVDGDTKGLQYRITRDDGSFDSGLRKLTARIHEELPLREGAFNLFTMRVLDQNNNVVPMDLPPIQIAQGLYSVAGQMLPEDISLVKDDESGQDTRLSVIFSKNTVLPTKGKQTVEVSKTVVKGSTDEIRIIVVEGPADRHSSTNKPIGNLNISGAQISRDLLKGTEIDLTFEMTESRDLNVSAYLNGTGQEFSQVFDQKPRTVPVRMLASEILQLEKKILEEQQDAEKGGNHEASEGLTKLSIQVGDLIGEATGMSDDDVTDDRFKIEDKKRRIAQAMHELTSGKRLAHSRAEYQVARTEASRIVAESGNDRERHQVTAILAREETFIHSNNPERISAATAELRGIEFRILMRTPDFLRGMFEHLVERRVAMNDQAQAKQLIENGKRQIAAASWDDLAPIVGRLWDLMPDEERGTDEMRHFTGIV